MVKDTQESGPGKVAPQKPYDFLIKIVIGGSDKVGKTSLLNRYVHGQYQDHYVATIGIDFMVKELETKNGDTVKLQAWDLAGQERFRSITSSYYRGARGMLLVYDVTNRESFEIMDHHLNEVQRMAQEDIVIFLIGNKADNNDSRRQVSYEEGKKYADENGVSFLETSARDNINVNEAFEKFVEAVVDQYKKDRANAASSKPHKQQSRSQEKLHGTKSKSKTCVIL
ncbi:Ras-related protein Rap-1b [Elysia marginata]|uniref:Ras-related protein Rap-1b n=1 Tax=Elysia marginata TaxID=1093978 RepID=A0AAV4I3A2_9GAST|nr:Ras-related protein Rap-1b [Elysia marginata]